MDKIILHTRDKIVNMDIDKAWIFTKTYNRKIKQNEVHTPVAAKIIVEHKHTITMFLLPNPIIKAEKDGVISVWTAAPYQKVIFKKPYIHSTEEIIMLVNLEKLLQAKQKIGLTMNEIFELERVNTLLTLQELIKSKAPLNIGGGF